MFDNEISRTAIAAAVERPSTRVDTMAALIDVIAGDENLPERRRQELCSGVRSLCRVLGLQIESTPADARIVAESLTHVTPAAARMSPGRLQNCRCLMDAALAYADSRFGRRRNQKALAPTYADLIKLMPDRWEANRLRRFFHFAGDLGVDPGNVDEGLFDRFLRSLTETTMRDPHTHNREARKLWNRMCESIPGWPGKPVMVPSYTDHWVLPADEFPQSLWNEVDAYLIMRTARSSVEVDDLLTEEELFGNGPGAQAAPIRASTANLLRYRMRQFASALVRKGVCRPSEIVGLSLLVKPEVVNAGLKYFIERSEGEKRNSQTRGIASDLLMIGKHWLGLPESDLGKLNLMVKRTRPVHEGLPESARRSLASFRDLENVRAFLALPDAIVAEAEKEKKPGKDEAYRVAAALWMKIAQRAPLRIDNLMHTDLNANILRSHKGKSASVALYYPPDQVKNSKALEVPLSAATVRMLELYLAKYRPLLATKPSNWLFPAEDGGPKRPSVMSTSIQRLMRERIGFAINPHSFRHVAAKLLLTAHPGDYDTVQRILGHKSRQTTVKYYVELEAEEAFKHFDAVLLKLEEPNRGSR
jgi:integrase